jgi:D-xylose transport system ATP-binding protein
VISHNLADIFDVSDRIIVLRLGQRVATFDTHTTDQQAVVAAITGAVFGALEGAGDGNGKEKEERRNG